MWPRVNFQYLYLPIELHSIKTIKSKVSKICFLRGLGNIDPIESMYDVSKYL